MGGKSSAAHDGWCCCGARSLSTHTCRDHQTLPTLRTSRYSESLLPRTHRGFAGGPEKMAGLKLTLRAGIYYAVGTIARQRIRKSLCTRGKRQAEELCAQYEARLWKRHSYGEH